MRLRDQPRRAAGVLRAGVTACRHAQHLDDAWHCLPGVLMRFLRSAQSTLPRFRDFQIIQRSMLTVQMGFYVSAGYLASAIGFGRRMTCSNTSA